MFNFYLAVLTFTKKMLWMCELEAYASFCIIFHTMLGKCKRHCHNRHADTLSSTKRSMRSTFL